MLTARKLLQDKLHDVEMSLRGIPRGFGLRWAPPPSRPTQRSSGRRSTAIPLWR